MADPLTAKRLEKLNSVANAQPNINGTTSLPMVITDKGSEPWLLVPVEMLKDAMSEVARLTGELDPPVCRLQFPDGSVPGNAREAAEGWKRCYDEKDAQLAAAQAEVARLRSDVKVRTIEMDAAVAFADECRANNAKLAAENERLRGQLPEGMQHCTILYRACDKGHGWLTATNWVDFPCPTCERDRLRAALKSAQRHLRQHGM